MLALQISSTPLPAFLSPLVEFSLILKIDCTDLYANPLAVMISDMRAACPASRPHLSSMSREIWVVSLPMAMMHGGTGAFPAP